MSMGRRKRRQETLFVATSELARSAGHPFYRKLNELLAEAEFDRWIEGRCDAQDHNRNRLRSTHRLGQSLRNSVHACHYVLTQTQTTVRSTDC